MTSVENRARFIPKDEYAKMVNAVVTPKLNETRRAAYAVMRECGAKEAA